MAGLELVMTGLTCCKDGLDVLIRAELDYVPSGCSKQRCWWPGLQQAL